MRRHARLFPPAQMMMLSGGTENARERHERGRRRKRKHVTCVGWHAYCLTGTDSKRAMPSPLLPSSAASSGGCDDQGHGTNGGGGGSMVGLRNNQGPGPKGGAEERPGAGAAGDRGQRQQSWRRPEGTTCGG